MIRLGPTYEGAELFLNFGLSYLEPTSTKTARPRIHGFVN